MRVVLPPYTHHVSPSPPWVVETPIFVLIKFLHVIACIQDPVLSKKILSHLDEKGASAEASPLPPYRAPPQAVLCD
jgi:hypothetical protein